MTEHTPHKPTLLLVDDQVLNIQLLQHIFQDDYTICSASTGAQALALCASQLPDLILLDVVMPVMDGHQVCAQLKADPRTNDIPIIFVTGQNNPEEESSALRMGAVDFISKPVNASVVKARVRSQLMLRQTLRQVQDLNQNLEARVAQRTAELQQALEHLQQSQEELAHSAANATLSTMIAGVSHELGTPLGNSKMVAGTMAAQTRDVVRDMQAGLLKRSGLEHYMEQATEGLALLQRNLERSVELLADFRQVAADQASEQRRQFDLAHAVNEILHTLSPSLKRHAQKVVVDIPGGITMDSLPGPLGQRWSSTWSTTPTCTHLRAAAMGCSRLRGAWMAGRCDWVSSTTARAWRPSIWPSCSSPSSAPKSARGAPVWAWPLCATW